MPDKDVTNAAPPPETGGLGLGERLRSARKARALTLEQVCDALHLDESVILALEDERFETLGAPVFVRGHLKTYARLVGLSPDAVLSAYRATDPGSEALPRVGRVTHDRSVTVNPVSWGVAILTGLVVMALGFYVLQDDDMPTAVPTSTTPASAPTAADTAASDLQAPTEPGAEPAVEQAIIELAPEQVVPETPSVDAGAEPQPAAEREPPARVPASGQVRLGLFFSAESWVEISDANRRLLFGLQREGIRRDLTGEPPFRLLLGNARGVQVFVNDVPYELPDDSINGNVARFQIAPAVAE
jgi:cytoskeleton protein RodZ